MVDFTQSEIDMKDFREFQAKNLDQAIQDACAYFGAEREKLEIEIVEDAKMGVFGLIGARKAKIRAKRVELPELNVAYEEKKKTPSKNYKPKNRFQDKNDKIENLEKKQNLKRFPLMMKMKAKANVVFFLKFQCIMMMKNLMNVF